MNNKKETLTHIIEIEKRQDIYEETREIKDGKMNPQPLH